MSENTNQRVLNLPALDAPEGHLRIDIEGQEPFMIPFMDYVTVDQVTEIIELQGDLENAETPVASMAATTKLLLALGLDIVHRLPAGHLLAIMKAWQAGPGNPGESDGSGTTALSEPIDTLSNTSYSPNITDSERSADQEV